MELHDLIKWLRGTKTQTDFGAPLGATKQQVSDWEKGRYKPDSEQLGKMGIVVEYRVLYPFADVTKYALAEDKPD
jgi:DNA-binding XRE family transcriptional regulator